GTATAADYTSASGTLNWADGDTADKTFTVTITSETTVESDETVNVTLSNAVGAVMGAQSTAVLTIVNDDVSLQFSAATANVNEDAGTVTLTVTRLGSSVGAVGVNYATGGGTATAGTDYTAASGTLSWAAGDAADKTFTVTITNDVLLDPGETFDATLSAPTGGATIGTTGTATVTIIDDDAPGTLQFSAATYSVNEGGGSVTITATRTGGSGGVVTVDYATSDGTATAGADYTTASGTLTWVAGDAAAKTFSVPITNDASAEGSETVNLTVSNPGGGAGLGAQSTAVLTIVDNPGTLQFDSASYAFTENWGTVTVTVTRTGGNGGAVSVNYATSNGTATAGSDYTAASGTLSWADGDVTSQTFNVPLTDDGAVESDETVNMTLSSPTGGAALGAWSDIDLIIVEDDVSLQFSSATYSGAEDGGAVTITVTRLGNSFGAVDVNYATSDGTALAGSDYTATSGTLSWASGDSAPKTFNVPILDDGSVESNETVNLALSGPTGGAVLGSPNTAVLTIVENDLPGSLQFTNSTYSTNEGSGSVTITVTRAGGNAGAVNVDYATSNGTATAGSDYTAASGTLSWASGDSASKTFNITITDDVAVEGNETVNLTLSNATGGASLGSPNTSVLTILENDGPTVTSTNPSDGNTDVSIATHMEITFSTTMNTASVESAISVAPVLLNPLQFFWNGSDTQVTVVFDTTAPVGVEADDLLAQNTTYTVTVGVGAQSSTGVPMAVPYVSDFTTDVDVTVPQLVSIVTNGGQDPRTTVLTGSVTTITLTFNESMNTTQGGAEIQSTNEWREDQVGGGAGTGMTLTWTSATTLQIALSPALASDTLYDLSVWSLSDDAPYYNNIEDDLTFMLVTASTPPDAVAPTITGAGPYNGQVGVPRDSGAFLSFSEPMAPDVLDYVGITPVGIDVDMEYGTEPAGIMVMPRQAWPANTTISITITGGPSGAKDNSGNALATTTVSFTTVASTVGAIQYDEDYSNFKNGMTGVDAWNLSGFLLFKETATGNRAWLNGTTLAPQDITLVETATGIPVKGYELEYREEGLRLEPRWGIFNGLKDSTSYTLNLNSSLQGSMGNSFTPTSLTFTTIASGGNARPKTWGPPEMEIMTTALGQTLELWESVDNSGPGDTITVMVQDSAPNTFSYSDSSAPGSTWFDFNYSTPGNDEAGITTTGTHVFTWTFSDNPGGYSYTVKSKGYVFASLPTVSVTGTAATPTVNWGSVPAEANALWLRIEDDLTGEAAYEAVVNLSASSFTVPSDSPLPSGDYSVYVAALRFSDGALRAEMPGMGIGTAAHTVP
ncbi:MAG: Ig-like domain-containing protein, partial [Planctomycetes bacterium]|nr:Ig-like domain-containing protein [Planctomycetota bacterium]